MTAPIALPDDWDPRASVQADMDQAGAFDSILKRHGLGRAGQFRPGSPWLPDGRLRAAGAPPAGPGTGPTNGGIR